MSTFEEAKRDWNNYADVTITDTYKREFRMVWDKDNDKFLLLCTTDEHKDIIFEITEEQKKSRDWKVQA